MTGVVCYPKCCPMSCVSWFFFSWLLNEAGYLPLVTSTVPGEKHLNITRSLKSEKGKSERGPGKVEDRHLLFCGSNA